MANLIVLRLVPPKPMSGSDFTNFLHDGGTNVLIVEAYDVSFAKQGGDLRLIGSASHVPDIAFNGTSPPVLIPAPTVISGGNTVIGTKIVQHRRSQAAPTPPPGNFSWLMKSVATATIVIPPPLPPPPPPPTEYDGPDIVVKLKWGVASDAANARVLATYSVDYNVLVHVAPDPFPPIEPNPANPNPTLTLNAFQDIPSAEVAAYIPLVDPSNDKATVTLPKDGAPPNFEELRAAINKVVTADPGGITDPAGMTPEQARHVAFEIAWNRHIDIFPSPGTNADSLENMYTAPVGDPDNTARNTFESNVTTYRATHDAQAETLAKYVFALSAALAMQNTSANTDLPNFSFPIRPDLPTPPSGKIEEAAVRLKLP